MPKSKKAKWRVKFDKQNKQDRPRDEAIGKLLVENSEDHSTLPNEGFRTIAG